MAIEVEDGTGKANAVSYVSLAYATSYHAARGNSAWASAASDAVREQALVKATDYMEQRFATRYRGARLTQTQALAWPRLDVVDRDGFTIAEDAMPDVLLRACSEYALRALSSTLAPDVTSGVSGTVKRTRSKVGPIEEETEYEDGASTVMPSFPAADRILRPILRSAGGQVIR